jgi:proline iminopeptidase
VDANVEDLENLRRTLELDAFILFGHSWGGLLAQAYILRYPEHVRKLILADTFPSAEEINLALARMRASVPPEIEAVYQKWESEGLYKGRDRYPDEYQEALDIAYAPVQISVPPPDYLLDVFSKVSYPVYREMWGDQSEFIITGSLAAMNAAPRLGEIRVPTLVIVGASDMPSVDQARRMADAIPNARLEVFENSRHFPFLEEPEKFYSVVREFINEE